MRESKKFEPIITVSEESLGLLSIGRSNFIDVPIDSEIVDCLPQPYESFDKTILVFPAKECPEWVFFRENEKSGLIIGRRIMNIMAYKKEDGSEFIRIRLKK